VQKSLQLPPSYHEFLQELKGRIRTAQVRAALAVNRELVLLYWSIGRDILAKQGTEGWGTRVVDRLAHDLQEVVNKLRSEMETLRKELADEE
jgi:DUF1016 N-terminal domain